jgi:putative transposase
MGFCGHHITVPKPEDHIEPDYNTSRKIRLKPTLEQKILLFRWFGVARKCYNEANASIRKKRFTLSTVRDSVIRELNELEYVNAVPLKVKQEAVGDYIKALDNAKEKYKKTKKFQKVKFRTRKAPSQSININKGSIKVTEKGLSIYPRTLGNVETDEVITNIPTHCRITLKYGRFFYLCIPQEMVKVDLEPVFKEGIVAIDPGERVFGTFYSPLIQGFVGEKVRDRLYKSYNEADKLRSKMDKIKTKVKKLRGKLRRELKNKIKHLRKKFLSVISKPTRLVKELHSKTALFLCKNFDTIMIPEYSSKEVAPCLCEIVNRSNQGLSHYTFRKRLIHTAKRFKRTVHIVPESYTSKTCTHCGYNNPQKSDKILTCDSCSLKIDRDIAGARNIYIKTLQWFINK